ncbi:MAG: hypothetical protein ABI846_04845, partial [Rudaea sp.]
GIPGGSDDATTTVTFTGTTNATNDSNTSNNTTTATGVVLDAIDDTSTPPGGTTGVTTNVGGNDQLPPGATFTLIPGSTCGGATVSSTGIATYNTPTTGGCIVNYRVCAPAPNTTVCDTATLTVTVTPPNAFDPPFATKSVGIVDVQTLSWTIIVDNNANATPQYVAVRDPLPAGMTFVSGQVSCTTFGASTLSDCFFDTATNRIVADGLLASDLGAANPATAPNRLVVTFQARFTTAPRTVTNVAQVCYDAQNDPANVSTCTQVETATAVFTPEAPAQPVPLPKWMLALLAVLLAASTRLSTRRSRPRT